MPAVTDKILLNYFKWRQRRIEKVKSNPLDYQMALLRRILKSNRKTEFGQAHQFDAIENYKQYTEAVALQDYESLFPYIDRMMSGESNILCSDPVDWFAKSSGTTTGRSKYIPVSKNYLLGGHLKCAWDAASFIYNEDKHARLFADKTLIMGGAVEALPSGKWTGDISGIIIKHFPPIGRRFYTPDFETALMHDWDAKIKKMARITAKENLTLVAGVPTWLMVLFDEILSHTGADNISEVWPHLRSFLHGGVDFRPYADQFKAYLPSDKITYREVYNASEGYFAIQDNREEDGMLLLCDNDIFFEFIDWENYQQGRFDSCTVEGLEKNKTYVLVISNTSGLYRYVIGDLIRVSHIDPVRIKHVGRTQAMINVFGEELSIDNVEMAVAEVCEQHGAQIWNYTVGPRFLEQGQKGGHEWLIEFIKSPLEMEKFERDLDNALRRLNSDYDAKRYGDLALACLQLRHLPKGSFEKWLRKRNSYGGQSKIPRLKNDRSMIEELLSQNGMLI